MNPEIDLLTLAEAAERLHVTERWLRQAIYNGWGPPYIKLGRQLPHFRPGDLARWLDSRTRLPKEQPTRATARETEG